MKIILDLDDFSVVNNRLDLLLKLKEMYPNFKVSLFTVPIDEKKDWGPYQVRQQSLEKIKKCLDWIQLIPHGYLHTRSEVKDMGYDEFNALLTATEEAFRRDGLPYEKGFKAPHWRWNADVVRVLDDRGWWGAVDPRQPKMLTPKHFYRYFQSIDNIDFGQDLLKLHGHVYGSRNDVGKCFNNLLPYKAQTASWHYVTEFLEEKV